MVVLEDDLERTSKYIRKWAKRFVTFDDESRKISYGMAKDKLKASMTVTKITRLAELQPVRSTSSDLYVVHVEGATEDGKPDTWTIRIPDAAKFALWHQTIRNCLAAQGLMDPLSFGLPDEDPRNGLPFVTVGLEYLHKFSLLEKAIMYYFGLATMHGFEMGLGTPEHIVMVGDRNLYIFRPNADVLRCIPIESISSLKGPADPSNPNSFAVISAQPAEHDVVLKASPDLVKILQIIADVYKGIKNTALPIQNTVPAPTATGTIDEWCESSEVALRPLEGYKMKAMSPTPKSKLKIALDLYQQQHGSMYSRSAPKRSKADKAAAVAKAAAAAGGGGGADGGAAAGGATDAIDDSLSRMLKRLGLAHYTAALRKQHVDVELLTCMDATDLINFGVKDPKHCEAILEAAADRDANGSPSEQSLAAPSSAIPAIGGGLGPAAVPQPQGAPQAPQAEPAKKMVIVLDSDDDDEDLLPIIAGSVNSATAFASPASPLGERSVVILDDSDDDLVVAPKPAPKPAINLDDDDDI